MEEDPFAPFVAPVSFQRFLELMKNESAKEFVRKINKFLQNFDRKKREPNKDSNAIQNFMVRIEADFKKHKVWKSVPPHEMYITMEGLEEYLTRKLHSLLFGKYLEDRERDEMLSARMEAMQFVQPSHLDIPPKVMTEEFIALAVKELQKMNAFQCPRAKLICMLNCCRVILNMLRNSGRAGDGADIFVPVLNYVVIRARPKHLISNIEFIKRFRMKTKLVSIAEYYFMQLSVSALFIETADAESFTDGREEFLTSFLENGLLGYEQYEEAMGGKVSDSHRMTQESDMTATATTPPSLHKKSKEEVNPRPDPDGSSVVSSEAIGARHGDPKMEISWDRISSYAELEAEGVGLVSQLAAEGDIVNRYPLMGLTSDLVTLGQVDSLLTEYRSVVMGYEVLKESTMHKDSPTIVKLISDTDDGRKWKCVWPSNGNLLAAYPFLSTAAADMTVGHISKLFDEYKEMVLKYEILEQALRHRMRSSDSSLEEQDVMLSHELDPEFSASNSVRGDECEVSGVGSGPPTSQSTAGSGPGSASETNTGEDHAAGDGGERDGGVLPTRNSHPLITFPEESTSVQGQAEGVPSPPETSNKTVHDFRFPASADCISAAENGGVGISDSADLNNNNVQKGEPEESTALSNLRGWDEGPSNVQQEHPGVSEAPSLISHVSLTNPGGSITKGSSGEDVEGVEHNGVAAQQSNSEFSFGGDKDGVVIKKEPVGGEVNMSAMDSFPDLLQ
ncbi:hypothetical protein BSKO_05108 [Bryopsis sp. KO-2023]|nr:hypothetical protein BSKO_05108 [Bryopsis sp. KO-2023]